MYDNVSSSMIAMSIHKTTGILLLIITGLLLFCGSGTADETGIIQVNNTTPEITGEADLMDIPNLAGVWNTKSEGTILVKSSGPGEYSHWVEGMKTLTGKIEIAKQEGRVLHGIFTDSQGKEEKIIGAIYFDNKHIRFADMDGMFDCELVDTDTIHMLYSHNTVNDSVVAVGTWTRE